MAEDEEYDDWVVEPPHDADEPDTGGSSSSGSSGGSSSSGGSNDDDTTSVVVTGDPGSSEEQEVVGQGDNLEEARADAATNPDFDADEGDPVDDVEESLGTDQPDINPDDQQGEETNVVVTGDPGSRERQRVVGRGQTRQGARVQAAANQRFDAAEGTRTDAIEEELGQGQGDDTTFQETRNQVQVNQERREQARQDQERQQQQPFKEARELYYESQAPENEDANQPTNELIREQSDDFEDPILSAVQDFNKENFSEDIDDLNPVEAAGEVVRRGGFAIMEGGQALGDFAGSPFEAGQEAVTPEVTTLTGQEPSEEAEEQAEEQFQTDAQEFAEQGFKAQEFTAQSIVQGPFQPTGILVSGGGGAVRIAGDVGSAPFNEDETFQSEIQDEAQDAAIATELVTSELAEQATENTGRFLAEEGLEEVGQGAVGLAAGSTGLGAAFGVGSFGAEVETEIQQDIAMSADTRFAQGVETEASQTALEEETLRVDNEDVPFLGNERDPGSQGLDVQESNVQGEQTRRIPQQTNNQPGQPVNEEGFTQQELEVLAGEEVTFEDVSPESQTETGGFDQQQVNRLRADPEPEEEPESSIESILDSNAIGLGPGGLLPPEQEVEPDIETDTDTIVDSDPSLSSPEQEVDTDTELNTIETRPTEGAPETGLETEASTETEVETLDRTFQAFEEDVGFDDEQQPFEEQDQDTGVGQENPPREEPPIDEPFQEPQGENEPGLDTGLEFGQEPEQENGPEITPQQEFEPGPESEFGIGEDANEGFFDAPAFEEDQSGSQPVASPDLTALMFGGGEENVGGVENPATGLERRAPNEEEEENFENDGFLNQF